MTNGSEYRLADKMQKQFRQRGADVSGMRASSTSELMRRAEMGNDPRVNCAEQAFHEGYRRHTTRTNPYARTGSAQTKNPNTYTRAQNGGTYTQAARTQAKQASGTQTRQEANTRMKDRRDTREELRDDAIEPAVEIKVKQKTFPPIFIALLLIGTVMVMCLVFSISEIYQTTGEIAQLESQLAALQDEADELRLRLEEKNDVRTIEEIATAELGMVKEDSLQRRYVSLSDGEYIELVGEAAEPEEETTGGVLLSSIFSSLGEFFERFK